MTYLLYFTAICLSAVAAYYSIAGLTAIFAAAVVPIMVMGGVLEFAKLVVASWIYRHWKEIHILMRAYFTFALVILMMLTSMGIFGYLSKAHLDQAVPTGDVSSKVALIDEKIKTEKENVEAARRQLQQMDAQVDQTLTRTSDDKGTERSLQIRRGQQKERTALLAEIGSAQTRIARLNEERAPIASELRKVEAEVGPIKYIAALLYGDNPDQTILEKAVRIVIIMIVIVFDPLAVLLLMAANTPLKKEGELNGNPTTEKSASEESFTEIQSFENTSEEVPSETESTNRIKERFFSKFRKPTTESLVQRTTEIGGESGSPTSDVTASPGVTTRTADDTSSEAIVAAPVGSQEVQESAWTINQPPVEHHIDLDSSARLNQVTPGQSDLIVDWSNKESTPKSS